MVRPSSTRFIDTSDAPCKHWARAKRPLPAFKRWPQISAARRVSGSASAAFALIEQQRSQEHAAVGAVDVVGIRREAVDLGDIARDGGHDAVALPRRVRDECRLHLDEYLSGAARSSAVRVRIDGLVEIGNAFARSPVEGHRHADVPVRARDRDGRPAGDSLVDLQRFEVRLQRVLVFPLVDLRDCQRLERSRHLRRVVAEDAALGGEDLVFHLLRSRQVAECRVGRGQVVRHRQHVGMVGGQCFLHERERLLEILERLFGLALRGAQHAERVVVGREGQVVVRRRLPADGQPGFE